MASEAGTNRLLEEIHRNIDYVRKEYELSYAEVIGVLRIASREMEDELLEVEAESDDR